MTRTPPFIHQDIIATNKFNESKAYARHWSYAPRRLPGVERKQTNQDLARHRVIKNVDEAGRGLD